jgi:hypothetical protein
MLVNILMAIGGFKLLHSLLKGKKELVNDKSNCNLEFLDFNINLNITKTKKRKLQKARKSIQDKIRAYFNDQPKFTLPKFSTQGSSKIGTMIRTTSDQCDYDVGIYFFSKPTKTFKTIQNHVKKALTGHTKSKISLLNKCVRANYSGDFHIDMPIYYTLDQKTFYLGSKSEDWVICDSKLFKDWVEAETKNKPQVIRIIRYLKAWSNYYSYRYGRKTPSGLAFTIWTIKYYEGHERDDVAFINSTTRILEYLNNNWKSDWQCKMPVAPEDNVLEKFNKSQRENLLKAFKELVEQGILALFSNNKSDAIVIWKKQFGKRFNIDS